MPGLISSLVLIMIGAIAKFAYSDSVWTWTSSEKGQSLQVDTVGLILMIVGLVALLLSIAYNFMSRKETVVIEKEPEVVPLKAKRTPRRKNPPVI